MRVPCLVVLLAACSSSEEETDTPVETGYRPTLVCPGDASCPASDDTTLRVGAASLSIEPDCYERWESASGGIVYNRSEDTFFDCGCDGLCPEDEGWPGADEGEGDGIFQKVYLAGGSNNVPAMGVRGPEQGGLRAEGDGLFAKAIVLDQGDTRVAIVAIESIGLQYDDTLATRALLNERGLDVDHLLVHSTHSHLSVDVIGLWGATFTESGYDARYAEQVRTTIVDAVEQAVAAAVPVRMEVGEVDVSTYNADKGIENVVTDTRDPFVIDPMMGVARFIADDDSTVATVVSYGIHPETVLGRTAYLSSDFVHALRATVEDGVVWQSYSRDGVGGTTVYLNSTVGGMMTTLRLTNTDPDGNDWGSGGSWEKADAIGQQLGEMALDAIEDAEAVTEPRLSVLTQQFFLPIDNTLFQTAGQLGVMERTQHNWDPTESISEDNLPEAQTEVNLIEVGPVQLLSIPGEMVPELAIGGYDGEFINSPGRQLVEVQDNPPDIANAPQGPYVKDELSASYRWIVGLGNDEIGYILPRYNFILSDQSAYIMEAPGDHYEETRSLGPSTAERIQEQVRALSTFER